MVRRSDRICEQVERRNQLPPRALFPPPISPSHSSPSWGPSSPTSQKSSTSSSRSSVEDHLPDNNMGDNNQQNGLADPPVRTLGYYGKPSDTGNGSSVVPPEINDRDFELKFQYVQMAQQMPYTGFDHECPNEHLRKFKDVV
ncbi:hypothetical protein LINGRAHAP2_LOCUS22395, partial [Linum grandiflorum]